MSRFSETETALLQRLRSLKAKPDMSLNLLDISAYMKDTGFIQDEITAVLNALEQEKILCRTTGNRLLILKELPQ